MRVGDRVPDARLGGEVEDHVEGPPSEQGLHDVPVLEVHLERTESVAPDEVRHPIPLQLDVVVVVVVVEPHDVVALIQQPPAEVVPDEPCGPGNEAAKRGRKCGRLHGSAQRRTRPRGAVPYAASETDERDRTYQATARRRPSPIRYAGS